MEIILFEKIKENCKKLIEKEMCISCVNTINYEVLLLIAQDANKNKRDWKLSFDAMKKEAFEIIDNWDIRCVKQLIYKFPKCVSTEHRKSKDVIVGINERNEWEVIFN